MNYCTWCPELVVAFFGLILWKAKASNGISVVWKRILSHLIKDDDQRTVCVITNDVIQYFCHLWVCIRRQQKVNLNQQHTILLHEDLSLPGIWGCLLVGVRCGTVPSAETLQTVRGEAGPVQHWETPVPYGIILGVSKCWYGKLFFTLSWMARSLFVLCLLTQCIVKKWAWHKLWGGVPQEQDLVRRKKKRGKNDLYLPEVILGSGCHGCIWEAKLKNKAFIQEISQTCARNIHEYNSSWLLNCWRAQLNIMSTRSFS